MWRRLWYRLICFHTQRMRLWQWFSSLTSFWWEKMQVTSSTISHMEFRHYFLILYQILIKSQSEWHKWIAQPLKPWTRIKNYVSITNIDEVTAVLVFAAAILNNFVPNYFRNLDHDKIFSWVISIPKGMEATERCFVAICFSCDIRLLISIQEMAAAGSWNN